MFSFLKKTPKRNDTAIVLVADSGEIHGSIVKFEEGEKPHLLYSIKEALHYEHELSGERLLSLMLVSLKRAMERIASEGMIALRSKTGESRVSSIEFVIGSPWHVSKRETVSVRKERSFIISKKEIEEAEKQAGGKDNENTLIERKMSAIRANGYLLEEPIGKRASEIEIDIYESLAEKEVLEKTADIIGLSFPHTPIRRHTIPIAAYSLGAHIITEKDYLLALPEHELTDVILVKDGVIRDTVTVPCGKNFLVRVLAESLNKTVNPAFSLLKLYMEDRLEPEKKEKVSKLVSSALLQWKDTFRQAIWSLQDSLVLPKKAFVFDDSITSEAMWKAIATDDYILQSLSGGKLDVLFLEPKDVESFIKAEPRDMIGASLALKVAILYFNSLSEKDFRVQ